jgi:trehalose 6-phosphate phosphatase
MQNPPLPSLDWCLFLDVDGTLVEFTESPQGGAADDTLKALLARVRDKLNGAVALISGRRVEHLDALFAPLHLPAAGLHGTERRDARGTWHGVGGIDPLLEPARARLADFIAQHPAAVLEDKLRTLAIHYRAAPSLEGALRRLTGELAAASGGRYHVQEGIMVFELKPVGFSKATAIAAFLDEDPFRGRMPVFIGDDLTDRDGFAVVEARGGLSIAVGGRVRAQRALDDPAAVHALLRAIAALPAAGQRAAVSGPRTS